MTAVIKSHKVVQIYPTNRGNKVLPNAEVKLVRYTQPTLQQSVNTMSFAVLARGCATRGSQGLRNMRRLPSATARPTITPRRFMGGGQPVSRSMEAELWEGHPKEPEGWETTVYLTYGATAVLLTMALGFAPDTSIKTVSFVYAFFI